MFKLKKIKYPYIIPWQDVVTLELERRNFGREFRGRWVCSCEGMRWTPELIKFDSKLRKEVEYGKHHYIFKR